MNKNRTELTKTTPEKQRNPQFSLGNTAEFCENSLPGILSNSAELDGSSDGLELQKQKIQAEFRTDGIPWTPYQKL